MVPLVTKIVQVKPEIPDTLLQCHVELPAYVGMLGGWRDYTLGLYADAKACERNMQAVKDIVTDKSEPAPPR